MAKNKGTAPKGRRKPKAAKSEGEVRADLDEVLGNLGQAIAQIEVIYHAFEAVHSRVGPLCHDKLTISPEVELLRKSVAELHDVHEQLDRAIPVQS